jgi:hypothetical protein
MTRRRGGGAQDRGRGKRHACRGGGSGGMPGVLVLGQVVLLRCDKGGSGTAAADLASGRWLYAPELVNDEGGAAHTRDTPDARLRLRAHLELYNGAAVHDLDLLVIFFHVILLLQSSSLWASCSSSYCRGSTWPRLSSKAGAATSGNDRSTKQSGRQHRDDLDEEAAALVLLPQIHGGLDLAPRQWW